MIKVEPHVILMLAWLVDLIYGEDLWDCFCVLY